MDAPISHEDGTVNSAKQAFVVDPEFEKLFQGAFHKVVDLLQENNGELQAVLEASYGSLASRVERSFRSGNGHPSAQEYAGYVTLFEAARSKDGKALWSKSADMDTTNVSFMSPVRTPIRSDAIPSNAKFVPHSLVFDWIALQELVGLDDRDAAEAMSVSLRAKVANSFADILEGFKLPRFLEDGDQKLLPRNLMRAMVVLSGLQITSKAIQVVESQGSVTTDVDPYALGACINGYGWLVYALEGNVIGSIPAGKSNFICGVLDVCGPLESNTRQRLIGMYIAGSIYSGIALEGRADVDSFKTLQASGPIIFGEWLEDGRSAMGSESGRDVFREAKVLVDAWYMLYGESPAMYSMPVMLLLSDNTRLFRFLAHVYLLEELHEVAQLGLYPLLQFFEGRNRVHLMRNSVFGGDESDILPPAFDGEKLADGVIGFIPSKVVEGLYTYLLEITGDSGATKAELKKASGLLLSRLPDDMREEDLIFEEIIDIETDKEYIRGGSGVQFVLREQGSSAFNLNLVPSEITRAQIEAFKLFYSARPLGNVDTDVYMFVMLALLESLQTEQEEIRDHTRRNIQAFCGMVGSVLGGNVNETVQIILNPRIVSNGDMYTALLQATVASVINRYHTWFGQCIERLRSKCESSLGCVRFLFDIDAAVDSPESISLLFGGLGDTLRNGSMLLRKLKIAHGKGVLRNRIADARAVQFNCVLSQESSGVIQAMVSANGHTIVFRCVQKIREGLTYEDILRKIDPSGSSAGKRSTFLSSLAASFSRSYTTETTATNLDFQQLLNLVFLWEELTVLHVDYFTSDKPAIRRLYLTEVFTTLGIDDVLAPQLGDDLTVTREDATQVMADYKVESSAVKDSQLQTTVSAVAAMMVGRAITYEYLHTHMSESSFENVVKCRKQGGGGWKRRLADVTKSGKKYTISFKFLANNFPSGVPEFQELKQRLDVGDFNLQPLMVFMHILFRTRPSEFKACIIPEISEQRGDLDEIMEYLGTETLQYTDDGKELFSRNVKAMPLLSGAPSVRSTGGTPVREPSMARSERGSASPRSTGRKALSVISSATKSPYFVRSPSMISTGGGSGVRSTASSAVSALSDTTWKHSIAGFANEVRERMLRWKHDVLDFLEMMQYPANVSSRRVAFSRVNDGCYRILSGRSLTGDRVLIVPGTPVDPLFGLLSSRLEREDRKVFLLHPIILYALCKRPSTNTVSIILNQAKYPLSPDEALEKLLKDVFDSQIDVAAVLSKSDQFERRDVVSQAPRTSLVFSETSLNKTLLGNTIDTLIGVDVSTGFIQRVVTEVNRLACNVVIGDFSCPVTIDGDDMAHAFYVANTENRYAIRFGSSVSSTRTLVSRVRRAIGDVLRVLQPSQCLSVPALAILACAYCSKYTKTTWSGFVQQLPEGIDVFLWDSADRRWNQCKRMDVQQLVALFDGLKFVDFSIERLLSAVTSTEMTGDVALGDSETTVFPVSGEAFPVISPKLTRPTQISVQPPVQRASRRSLTPSLESEVTGTSASAPRRNPSRGAGASAPSRFSSE